MDIVVLEHLANVSVTPRMTLVYILDEKEAVD